MASDERESDENDPAPQVDGELEWVRGVKADIVPAFPENIIMEAGARLPYTFHVFSYGAESSKPARWKPNTYQTDLLIAERVDGSTDWVPRVVVEFKLRLTTHDALTYSAKAATHKNVHPYLRYGIVVAIGRLRRAIPRRLIRHGHNFDFMLMVNRAEWPAEREQFCALLKEEVRASREMEKLLSKKTNIKLVHQNLQTSELPPNA